MSPKFATISLMHKSCDQVPTISLHAVQSCKAPSEDNGDGYDDEDDDDDDDDGNDDDGDDDVSDNEAHLDCVLELLLLEHVHHMNLGRPQHTHLLHTYVRYKAILLSSNDIEQDWIHAYFI